VLSNEIFVGRGKPAINYVLAVQTQAAQGENEIFIRGRGTNINKAVNVAQISINRFPEMSFSVNSVIIGTDIFKMESGKDRNVSTIKICLKRI